MFKASLKDVGNCRVTKDVLFRTGCICDAEIAATAICADVLDRDNFRVVDVGDGEYNIMDGRILLGSFTIVKQ